MSPSLIGYDDKKLTNRQQPWHPRLRYVSPTRPQKWDPAGTRPGSQVSSPRCQVQGDAHARFAWQHICVHRYAWQHICVHGMYGSTYACTVCMAAHMRARYAWQHICVHGMHGSTSNHLKQAAWVDMPCKPWGPRRVPRPLTPGWPAGWPPPPDTQR